MHIIEDTALPSEIEQLPDLAGLLKLASQPEWRRIILSPRARWRPEMSGGGTMELEFRDVRSTDYASRFGVAAANRFASHPEIELWECIHESQVVGHCDANRSTGEIIGLSVLDDYRRRGIGRRLLSLVVSRLRAAGAQRIWLSIAREPRSPAYDFYLAVGWRPTGEQDAQGDDILTLEAGVVR